MLEERENDGKDDTLLDAKDDDGSGSDEGQGEFVRFGALNFSQAAMVDKFDADMEDNGGEDDVGEKAERPGEKKENREDHSSSGEVRPLTAAARGVHHGGLGGTCVDDESAAACCGGVGKGEADEVHILVELVPVLECVGARSGGTLRQDDDETGQGDGKHHDNVVVGEGGETQMGKATGNGADDLDATVVPMEVGAGRGHANHGEESARETGSNHFEQDDDGQDGEGNEQAREMRVAQVLKSIKQLAEEAVAALFNA